MTPTPGTSPAPPQPRAADDPEALRETIAGNLLTARERTRLLTESVADDDLVRQHSPLMSPLVWDLAHIANQEELWLLRAVGGREPMRPDIDPLYDAFEHPRAERPTLPLLPPAEARAYAGEVRGRVLDLLDTARFAGTPLVTDGFAFGMVAQHEQQHDETMLITHQLRRGAPALSAPPPRPAATGCDRPARRGAGPRGAVHHGHLRRAVGAGQRAARAHRASSRPSTSTPPRSATPPTRSSSPLAAMTTSGGGARRAGRTGSGPACTLRCTGAARATAGCGPGSG